MEAGGVNDGVEEACGQKGGDGGGGEWEWVEGLGERPMMKRAV